MTVWNDMATAPKDRQILVKDEQFGIVVVEWTGAYRWLIQPVSTDLWGADEPLCWAELPPVDYP